MGPWSGNTNVIVSFDSPSLPFADKSFSECRLFHVLEHARDPQKLLTEAIRISDSVHARYPYKYDRIPYVIKGIFSLNFDYAWSQARGLMSDRFTDGPNKHRWKVGPFGRGRINRTRNRILGRIPIPTIPVEWECWYP